MKLIIASQENIILNNDNTVDIVIFPAGHHSITAGSDSGPTELEIDINKSTFDKLYANLQSTYSDITKLYSDFNHSNGTVSSYLQDLKYDIGKGIIATIRLTEKGLLAVKNNLLKYFSPSFYIDEGTNEIINLATCFGAFTDNPAFTSLKQYPIQCCNRAINNNLNNIYNKDITTNNNNNMTDLQATINAVKAELAPTTSIESTTSDNKVVEIKAENLQEDNQPPKEKVEDKPVEEKKSDTNDSTELYTKEFEAMKPRFLELIKSEIDNLVKQCQANEQKVQELNAQFAVKNTTSDKIAKLNASVPGKNIDVVNGQTINSVFDPHKIMATAIKIQKENKCNFDTAWQKAKFIEII